MPDSPLIPLTPRGESTGEPLGGEFFLATSGGEFFTISTRGCKFFTRCRFRTGFMNTVHCTVPAYSTAYSTVLHLRTLRDIMENCTLWKTHLRSRAAFAGCVRGLRSVRTTAGTQVQRVCLPPACIRSCSAGVSGGIGRRRGRVGVGERGEGGRGVGGGNGSERASVRLPPAWQPIRVRVCAAVRMWAGHARI